MVSAGRKDSQLIIRSGTNGHDRYVMTQDHARARSRFSLRTCHPYHHGEKESQSSGRIP